ncbi:hypothetical protein DYB37_005985 [Aphanomyces astaci]|uniref:Guanylate kinase-like domain-containing protein n=2 Tax=Aphanomyces astaci TaxID=112090 RepID=A0A3R7AU22_APHAT|nr:hypothetical protein DYB37_005985 [Aphanomyces astaci]RQM28132.1 hypothetical protein B5M09_007193 [Aphanomyces astaci]
MDKGVQSLTFEELSILNERKEEIKHDHNAYLDGHPELKTLLSSFMSAVLIEKPSDVLGFAKDHFDALKPIKISHPYPMRFLGEVDGVAYNFVTADEFESHVQSNAFLEFAYVHGNGYGTSVRAVEEVQTQEKICILDIDIQVKKSSSKMKFLFIAPPSMSDLEKRLRGRGTEAEEKVTLRLANAKAEMDFAAQGHFDKVLVNNDLDEAFAELEETMAEWYPQFRFK